MATTQPEQTPVQMQHRARVTKLRLHIAASPVRMERQPRRPFRKAAVQRGVPRHWRAGRVAPKAEARLAQLTRVLQLIGRYSHLADPDLRSEEHTSELQSLMRNSYAVFCLKN